MNIALDYDGTYTADPILWSEFLESAKSHGHQVLLVTMREESYESVPLELLERVSRVIYTNKKAKMKHMKALGIHVSIWIDDAPNFIIEDAWTGD